MKATNIENRLALIGAVLVLIGVSSAAEDALGEGASDVTSTAVAVHEAAEETAEIAAEANADAASRAIEALAEKNWLDLDIRLEDHTSTLVAGAD